MVASLASALSFERARAVVRALDAERLHAVPGRWVLVACHATTPADYAYALRDLVDFCDRAVLPIVYCEPERTESLRACASRLAFIADTAARMGGASPCGPFASEHVLGRRY